MRRPRPSTTGIRQLTAVVIPVHLPANPPWPTGPLPFAHGQRRTTSDTRRTYFTPAAARVLYGTPERPVRWHHPTDHTHGQIHLDGIELLRTPTQEAPRRALAVLHLTLTGPTPLDTLRSLAHRPGAAPSPLPALAAHALSGIATIEPGALPYTVTLLTPGPRPLPRLHRGHHHRTWPPTHQWLWALASRTNPHDYPPHPDSVPGLTADTLHISADWSALVLRHGAAFIGHRADHGPTDPFYGYAELHTRSVYLDALLFGMIQRDHIDQLTEDLTDVFTGPGEAARLAALERRLAHFRSIYWRQHLTTHGTANDLLTAYQNQYRLPERFTEILAEAADHNRLIQTRENQQISGALGIITILGLPLTTALTVIQVLGYQTPWHLLTAALTALAATGALLTTPYGRLVLNSLRGRRDTKGAG